MNTLEINGIIDNLTIKQLIFELERHPNLDVLDNLVEELVFSDYEISDISELDQLASENSEDGYLKELVLQTLKNHLDEWQLKAIAWDNR